MTYNPDQDMNRSDDPIVRATHDLKLSTSEVRIQEPHTSASGVVDEILAATGEGILRMDRSRQ
ncbi:MAG: hypothetical protein AAB383_00225 [Patescibacteria group bacterium]